MRRGHSGRGVRERGGLIIRRITKKAAGKALVSARNGEQLATVAAVGERVVALPRAVTVAGKAFQIDRESLIRMVRQVTQTIGEYNGQDNAYAAYVTAALRKARGDMVSDLERYFGVHWRIDEATGKSVFYV